MPPALDQGAPKCTAEAAFMVLPKCRHFDAWISQQLCQGSIFKLCGKLVTIPSSAVQGHIPYAVAATLSVAGVCISQQDCARPQNHGQGRPHSAARCTATQSRCGYQRLHQLWAYCVHFPAAKYTVTPSWAFCVCFPAATRL